MSTTARICVAVTLALCAGLGADSAPRTEKQLFPLFISCSRPGLCPPAVRLPVYPEHQHPPQGHQSLQDGVSPPSLCGNLCVEDDICAPQKKCCPTTCGYACVDAVHLIN